MTALPTPNGPPFHFTVTHLTARAGRIEIQLHNAGGVGHNVRIQTGSHCCFGPGYQDLGGTQTIEPGQTTAATVTLKPGRYFFICSIAQHWEHHMQGVLIVS